MVSSRAWQYLSEVPSSHLVDVRGRAEISSEGSIDLAPIGKNIVVIPLIDEATAAINMNFEKELKKYIPNQKDEVLFICKSGYRSSVAANNARSIGYGSSANVTDGFTGWKMSNLACRVGNE